jgi:deoxyribose-phosphate aldolase
MLKGTEVHIMAAISYPRGMVPIVLKVKEIHEALNDGANEIDMVLNLDAIKSGNYDLIEKEISALREATLSLTAKAILETTLLNDEEIIQVCRIASEIGIDYVKTSTGFNGNQATIHAVQLMKKNVFNKTKVKAAGGINKLDKVIQMLKAGARRIGTSAGPAIMEEYKIKKIDLDHIMTD